TQRQARARARAALRWSLAACPRPDESAAMDDRVVRAGRCASGCRALFPGLRAAGAAGAPRRAFVELRYLAARSSVRSRVHRVARAESDAGDAGPGQGLPTRAAASAGAAQLSAG